MEITIIILLVTITLFIHGKLRSDLVALMSMLSLFVFGVLSSKEALAGFSNNTVIMIAGLFIVGESLSRTGITAWLGNKMVDLSKGSANKLFLILLLGTAVISAFISNTGTVASLIPVAIAASWRLKTPASKMLIPLAFAANTGGLLTLTGTPPNIIANQALINSGFKGFTFFEYAMIGIPLLIAMLFYMYFVGRKLLPSNESVLENEGINNVIDTFNDDFKLNKELYQLRIRPNSSLVNVKIEDLDLESKYGIVILGMSPNKNKIGEGILFKKNKKNIIPNAKLILKMNDVLLVKGNKEHVVLATNRYNLGLTQVEATHDFIKNQVISDEIGLAELLISPRSYLKGQKIDLERFERKYNLKVLAVSRENQVLESRKIVPKEGDTILVRAEWNVISELQNERRNFLVVGHPEEIAKEIGKISLKGIFAIASLLFMILMLLFSSFSSAMVVLLTCLLMVATSCINMAQAYKAINWNVVIIIAAMIPMGTAMQKTGLATEMANTMVKQLGDYHPSLLLAGVFIITTSLSQVMSNSATTVLMAPIVLDIAVKLGVSPAPFLMMLAVSASTAFLTPFGTTTNMMVMNAGKYKFKDYFKVGIGLLAIFLAISLVLIPMIWPYK